MCYSQRVGLEEFLAIHYKSNLNDHWYFFKLLNESFKETM